MVITTPAIKDSSPGALVIACGSEVIARHERSYEREVVVFDPLHYLALLEQKNTRARPGSAASRLAVAGVLCAITTPATIDLSPGAPVICGACSKQG